MQKGKLPDRLLIHNAKTGQAMESTRKQFLGAYQDKGFVIVDRNTDTTKPTGKKPAKGEPAGENIGSAADVASRLGIAGGKAEGESFKGNTVDPGTGKRVIGQPSQPTTAANAAEGVTGPDNAINVNDNDASS